MLPAALLLDMRRDIVAAAACIEMQLFMRAKVRVIEASSQASVCVFACVCALKRAHVFVWWSAMSGVRFYFPFAKKIQLWQSARRFCVPFEHGTVSLHETR